MLTIPRRICAHFGASNESGNVKMGWVPFVRYLGESQKELGL